MLLYSTQQRSVLTVPPAERKRLCFHPCLSVCLSVFLVTRILKKAMNDKIS